MDTHVHEIAGQVFRLSTVVPDAAPGGLMQLEELGFCAKGEAKDFATVERPSL